jgi:transcription-repair coupling factor (superfamily II helicase)
MAKDRQPTGRLAHVLDALAQAEDGPIELVGTMGGYAGLLLAELHRQTKRPLVVVTADETRARTLQLALSMSLGPGQDLDPCPGLWPLDHSPFSGMSPSRTLVMERVATLFRMTHHMALKATVIPALALLDKVVPRAVLTEHHRTLRRGDQLDRADLLQFLATTGYHPMTAAEDPGTFAVRGGIIDLFCPLYPHPFRVDLWGDEIDSIRAYDPGSQRTIQGLNRDLITLAPARELLLTVETVQQARAELFGLGDDLNVPSSRVRALLDDLESGVLGVGTEELLPAFYPELDTPFDLVAEDALWVIEEPERVRKALSERWAEAQKRSASRRATPGELAFTADRLYSDAEEISEALSQRASCHLVPFAAVDSGASASIRFDVQDHRETRRAIESATQRGDDQVLSPLTRQVRRWREQGIAVVAFGHSAGGAEKLGGLMAHYGLAVEHHAQRFDLSQIPSLAASRSEVALFVGDFGEGFIAEELGVVVLDERDILGRKVRRRRRPYKTADIESTLASWRDLKPGDYVVHLLHGVGRYGGLVRRSVGAIDVDLIELNYAGGDRLFVPVDRLHLVSRYSASESKQPKIDRLGGVSWQRTTQRVRKAVRDIADKLLTLYAERELREGHGVPPPGEYFAHFEAAFPWEETPDQARAITEVLDDMQAARPMDRLVCGDVGFGKTEVAMRAACLAILGGKQVAVLVPTVVLAEQHRLTFERRFADMPVEIASMTRAQTPKQARLVREGLASGRIDVVVGTHKLLSDGIVFKDLGLLVIDEEHRFGVTHKERIKGLRPDVDVLTLTATPIPRTLHMAMAGLRDVSLIQTPPIDRLAIRTMVAQPTEQVITESIDRELERGGQVFFVHNRVQDIEKIAELIVRLVPNARVGVAHGQMERGALEKVMVRFLRGDITVLICTTVIESGLDIPRANTILIDRADRFGLSQLYQLRGRVGRSSVRALCYLLIPAPSALTGDAAERIATLQRFTALGSGFNIASHDLDIRGAGDLLGADQAGRHIDAVGYDAFVTMLREAVDARRAGMEEAEVIVEPELKVAIEARIPESWLPDTALRLRLYRQLAGAESTGALFQLLQSLTDRFGHPPEAVRNLVGLMAVRIDARRLGLSLVGYNSVQISLTPTGSGLLGADVLTAIIQAGGMGFNVSPDPCLYRAVTPEEWAEGLSPLRDSLRGLVNFATSL